MPRSLADSPSFRIGGGLGAISGRYIPLESRYLRIIHVIWIILAPQSNAFVAVDTIAHRGTRSFVHQSSSTVPMAVVKR